MAKSERFACSRRHRSDSSKSDYICLDLLLLILNWFPVKTLLICRSVCKSWKQIIDSTPFILDHLAHQRPRILLQKHNFEYHLLDPDYHPIYDTISAPDGIDLGSEPSTLIAVSTIHGVVCLYDCEDNLFLWNPSIRRHMRIPFELTASTHHESAWPKYCGFWMDSRTKEFKVVIFCLGHDVDGASVFSSRDQQWREFGDEEMAVFTGYQTDVHSPHLLINGVAHWIVSDYQGHKGGAIVYYDFGQDKFGEIDLPEQVRDWSVDINFSKWEDCLSILVAPASRPPHQLEYEIWVLKSGSWSKLVRLFRPIVGIGGVFAVLNRYNALATNSDGEMVLYNTKYEDVLVRVGSRKDRDIPLNLNHRSPYLFSLSFDFVESLIFPDQNCISSAK